MTPLTQARGSARSDERARVFREAELRYLESVGLVAEERFVTLSPPPVRVRLLERGSGEVVLFVHGGGGVAAHWAPLMARLDGYHLIALDRPGCGLTDAFNNRGVDLRAHAVDVLGGVLDAIGAPRAHIVANSMGALWSLWLALAVPDRVASLALLGCPSNVLGTSAPFPFRLLSVPRLNARMLAMEPPSTRQARTIFRRMGHDPESLSPEFIDLMVRAEELPSYPEHWLSLLENIFSLTRKRVGMDARQLRQVHQPVQLVWGDGDPFGPPSVASELCAILPRARGITLAAGHLPWVDHPDRCADIIRAFWTEVAPTPLP
ncbi:MAG: alpha/beta hydrolase [Chloroflexota bacterium]